MSTHNPSQPSGKPVTRATSVLSRSVSWDEALREFVLHKQATFAAKTVRYYSVQLAQLVAWAESEGIAFEDFGKRHMDRYTAFRINQGRSRSTLRHDNVCAKNFLAWCAKNDLLDHSRLAEYEVHNAPKPHKHIPADAEVTAFLEATAAYWDPDKHRVSGIVTMPGHARLFHRTRSAALYMGLIDTACRMADGTALYPRVNSLRKSGIPFCRTNNTYECERLGAPAR